MKAQDLKNSILQMAVQGKLVPQDPNDEPASVLLERIRRERANLIREKKIKAPKGGESVIYRGFDGSHYEKRGNGEPVCIDDVIPFEIPDSWEWARLGSLLQLVSDGTHKTPDYKDSGVLFLSVQNISKGYFDLTKVKYVSEVDHEKLCERVRPQNGDILFCRIGTLGKPIIVDVDFDFSIFVSLGLLRPIELGVATWIVSCIDSPHGVNWIQSVKVGGGTHTFKINLGDIPDFMVPIPPLAEQQRIVERIDELMPLVEDYGKLEDAREALDAALPERLRKSVLQMAVQGKLVEQDPADEPASVLLEHIREERAKLIEEKKIKAPKGGESVIYRGSDGCHYEKRGNGEPVCIDDEIPFEIPDSWEWCRLGDLGDWKAGATPAKGNSRYYKDGTIPWLLTGDLTGGMIDEIPNKITEAALKECSVRLNPIGSILVAMYGATIGKIGLLAVAATTNQACCACIPYDSDLTDWLMDWLRYQRPYFVKMGEGGAQPNISREKIVNCLVPIPPLAEQRRICKVLSSLDDYRG